MNQEDGSSAPQPAGDPFGRKSSYGLVWLLAVLGMAYGIVVAAVLSTSPIGRTAAMYAAGGVGVLGIVAGARYGFFFNIVNRCKGGQVLWAFIGGVGGIAVGVLIVAMVAAIVGTLAGLAIGWGVGSSLSARNRALLALLGAVAGAVVQASWHEPAIALRAAALGGVCSAVAGPLVFFTCLAVGYIVLRGAGRGHFSD